MIKTTERFHRWFTLLNDSDRGCVLPVADREFTHWLKSFNHKESRDGQNAGTAYCG